MPNAWGQVVGTIRGVIDGDARARERVGRWAQVIISDEAQERLHTMLGWLERVQVKSFEKWYPDNLLLQCAVSTSSTRCRAKAAGPCSCCGRPVCLQHSMVSMDADLMCAPCFAVARQHAKPFASGETGQDPDRSPFAQAVDPDNELALANAYRVLRVKPDVSDEELRKAYKMKLKASHPDQKRTAEAKQRAETKFKDIRAAWDIICKARGIS